MTKGSTSPERGSLIVVDGPSGTGKNTLIRRLLPEIHSLGVPVSYVIEEKLDKKRGEILKARKRGKEQGGTGDREMTEVLVEHRAQIYEKFVEPQIEKGRWVVADRGESATLAYQTARGELNMEDVWSMHREREIRTPEAVILTNCPPETAILRELVDKRMSKVRRVMETKPDGLSGKVTVEKGASEVEQDERRKAIHGQFKTTARFLKSKGVSVLSLDTGRMTVEEEVETALGFLGLRKG